MAKNSYKFRDVLGEDTFEIANFIKKFGVEKLQKIFEKREELEKALFRKNGEEVDIAAIGSLYITLIDIGADGICDVKEELPKFLAYFSNLTSDEIKKLPIGTYFKMIRDFIMLENVQDFLSVICPLLPNQETATPAKA